VPAVDKNKKKNVVKIIMPNAYIDDIIENPDMMRELSNEEMVECLEEYRQSYAIAKVINAKNHAYQQALITQYHAFGFAYDEKEVIDEEEEVVVLKN
jgi:L-arabinose isomerase